ncbi:MAG: 3-oxoacyl-ACP synthase, partial [Patescibacteria group bacterium]
METFNLNFKISDIEYYLPQTVIDNQLLSSRYPEWNENKIYEKTGIRSRHVVNNDEHVSDLAVNAAKKI